MGHVGTSAQRIWKKNRNGPSMVLRANNGGRTDSAIP